MNNTELFQSVLSKQIQGYIDEKKAVGYKFTKGAAMLLLLEVVDQEKAIYGIPWSTLILVSGVAILVNVVNIAGGIDMLSAILASIMTERTAPGILAITSGFMSAVSSASGVVMPTLIPTIPNIVSEIGVGNGQMGKADNRKASFANPRKPIMHRNTCREWIHPFRDPKAIP